MAHSQETRTVSQQQTAYLEKLHILLRLSEVCQSKSSDDAQSEPE